MTDNKPPNYSNILLGNMKLSDDFGDTISLINMRKWLQDAIEAKGAKQIGAGMGMGEADIDFILEGCEFNVTIKPRIKQPLATSPNAE